MPSNCANAQPAILWPRDLRERYRISPPTLWRWERQKKVPARDIHLKGGRSGWRINTILAAEAAPAANRRAVTGACKRIIRAVATREGTVDGLPITNPKRRA